jgi:hypothetical protein
MDMDIQGAVSQPEAPIWKSDWKHPEYLRSRTFQKLPPVNNTGCDLERHDMALFEN